MRIAVAGFHHETHSFVSSPAHYDLFLMADGWPPLSLGDEIVTAARGINLPVSGFLDEARRWDITVVPLLWCSATPCGLVTRDAYEKIAGALLDRLSAAGPIDGLYLDLHGAMIAEHEPDGEGAILRRIRAVTGPALPIIVSLDYHANVSPEMMQHATVMTVFRTYPHIDMAETGARAAELFSRLPKLHGRAFRKLPFLIPLTAQCSLEDPMRGLLNDIQALEAQHRAALSFAPGFPPGDSPHAGPSILAYAEDQDLADRLADTILTGTMALEEQFAPPLYSAAEGVAEAIRRSRIARRPVILADTQDNPGAGAMGDSTGILAELVRQKAEDAVVALLIDPEAAKTAHQAGLGAEIQLDLGGKSPVAGVTPFKGRFRVEALGDGRFPATGPFYKGSRMQLGPMARLRIGGTQVLVASHKQQAADQAMLRHLHIDPARQKILALKSSVHFRADFAGLAEAILVVAAPGSNLADHRDFPFRHLPSEMRLMPLGPRVSEWQRARAGAAV